MGSAIAFLVALAIAIAQAPFRRAEFVDGLVISCYAVGGFVLVMGVLGGAAFGRATDAQARKNALGHLPGLPGWAQQQENEPAETPTAVLMFAGLALIAVGIILA